MTKIDIENDLPKGASLLDELAFSSKQVYITLNDLLTKVKEGDAKTENGVSLLELKNHLFLSYLGNLSYTTLLKLSGLPLNGHSSIERLVELRVSLERMRPIEEKIKRQIENYLKDLVLSGKEEDGAQTESKNTLDNIEDSSSDEEESVNSSKTKKQLYKIPKISQAHFPETEKEDARKAREKMRILSSSMLRDALEEYTQDPEVIHNLDTLKHKAVEKRNRIERYEEENFKRLQLTKKEQASLSEIATPGTIGQELLSFRPLDFGEASKVKAKQKKRKSRFSSKKGKKKGFKKRRH